MPGSPDTSSRMNARILSIAQVKPAFTEEFSQVAAAMRSIFVDDDDDDAFAGFTGKATLTDPVRRNANMVFEPPVF